MADTIYAKPEDYDLEHEGDDRDVRFFQRLVTRLRPQRVLELACGSGRVTLPLAAQAVREQFDIVGLELSRDMLDEARRKLDAASDAVRARASLVEGDMRTYQCSEPFDVILVPCSSLCHLLSLEDQLAAWSQAHRNLRPGGRFVVDVTMPDLRTYAESLQTPPRAVVEMDIDSSGPASATRLIRYKATYYEAHTQRARIHFFYDKYQGGGDSTPDRFISDFESHVYFPRELELLFRYTGFDIEAVYADYEFRPLSASSRDAIMVGRTRVAPPAHAAGQASTATTGGQP